MNLRAWQAEALPLTLARLRAGEPALVSACTGAGKSVFLAALLADVVSTLRPGWCIVVTVPTEALVEQLAATLREHLPAVGRWYGRARDPVEAVTVCCLPSLAPLVVELRLRGLRCALWVGDEAHRAEAYTGTLEALAPARRLGVTATPYRADTGLSLWPEVTYRYSMDRALAEGVLVPVRPVHWHAEEGVSFALAETVPTMVGPGVVSARDIAEAELRAEELSLAAIHSRLSHGERASLIERLRTGQIPALVHVRVLSEGVDLPWLRWLALGTSYGRTRVGLVQEVGRVLRAHPGKTEAVIFDPLDLLSKYLRYRGMEDLIAAADEPEADPRGEGSGERDPALERAEELTVQYDALASWLSEMRWSRLGQGYAVRPGMASDKQLQTLARLKKASRWLAPELREVVSTLVASPERHTRATASDLIEILMTASRQAREHRERGGDWNTAPRLSFGPRP